MAQILSIGLDSDLLVSRALALEETGAETLSFKVEPALLLLAGEFYDVVVLCHTLDEQDVARVCRVVDLYWPLTRVVIMTGTHDQAPQHTDLDGAVSWHSHAFSLLQCVKQVLSESPLRQAHDAIIIPIDTNVLYSEPRGGRGTEPVRH